MVYLPVEHDDQRSQDVSLAMNRDRIDVHACASCPAWRAVGSKLIMLLATLGTCAAATSGDARRQTGEKYARAFSDTSRGVHVSWDNRACTFTEASALAEGLSGPPAVRVTVVPAARTAAAVATRSASSGVLDVVFRCAVPPLECIERARRIGPTLTKEEPLREHTMSLAAPLAAVPRVSAELNGLRDACVPTDGDAGH